jgi:hypothetical protein
MFLISKSIPWPETATGERISFLSKTLTKSRSIFLLSPNSPCVLRVDYTIVSTYSNNEEKKAILYTVTRIYAVTQDSATLTGCTRVLGQGRGISVRQAQLHKYTPNSELFRLRNFPVITEFFRRLYFRSFIYIQ